MVSLGGGGGGGGREGGGGGGGGGGPEPVAARFRSIKLVGEKLKMASLPNIVGSHEIALQSILAIARFVIMKLEVVVIP